MVIDLSVYPKEVVISVLHRLSYVFTGKIVSKENQNVEIDFVKIEHGYVKENLEELIVKELNDQILREKISQETEDVRNLILAHAFSKTNFIKSYKLVFYFFINDNWIYR